ncbi:hypothetical protein L3i20_v243620 [Paenibacillus sp. L3-i20]|nr:hypothetical protein L3i20_v243620 [Paenibacillus sp. L3-i20]
MYVHTRKKTKGLILLLAFTVIWGTLFTGFADANEGEALPDQVLPVEEQIDTITDNIIEAPLPIDPEASFAIAASQFQLIEDFEDVSDITISEVRTVPGSTKLNHSTRPGPVQYGRASGQFNYNFTGTEGTSASYMNFNGASGRILDGYPKKLGMWVYGDGAKHWLRGMLEDKKGVKPYLDFTVTGGLDWNGWKYVTANVPANLEAPIKLRQIYIAELNNNNKNSGTLFFDQLSAIYSNSSISSIDLTGLHGLEVGEKLQAQVLATTNGAVTLEDVTTSATFKSSSDAVAIINEDGEVEATGLGTTVITATYGDLHANYPLTVSDTPVLAESIELEGSIHLETGASENIKAYAFYSGQMEAVALKSGITYTSSLPEVASITNDGIVTASGIGTTTISASYEGRSFTYLLTVKQPIPILQTIRIADLTPLTEGNTKTLSVFATYSMLGEEIDVTNKAQFQSSNPSTATVSTEGIVSAIAAGTTKIKAIFEGKVTEYLLIVTSPKQLPKRELRAAWIASVENIDWPKKEATTVEEQKSGFIELLDDLADSGINAVIVQIKPTADAFYPSKYAPWSEWLTGTQGKDPGYDPLAFMLEEVHKRNMEFHAWFNPYRISMHTDPNKLVDNHPAKLNPDWVENYGGKLIFNPGVPEATEFVIDSVMEVVNNYDIDAVHFDDYFYPYPVSGADFPDSEEFAKYGVGFTDKAAWRRNNVDTLIKGLADEIKASKPYVKFGISPFGIWRNKNTDPTGSDTNGLQSYDALFADTKGWLEKGWLDYIAPQNYWHFGNGPAAYEKVLDWWRSITKDHNVHLYIGQAMYRVNTWENPEEMANQLLYNRSFPAEIDGSMFFSAKNVVNVPDGIRDTIVSEHYRFPALPPTMPWLDNVAPKAPILTSAIKSQIGTAHLMWEDVDKESDATYYAIYRQEGSAPPDISNAEHLLTTVRKVNGAGEAVTSYIDKTVSEWNNYTYAITALDRLHNESSASDSKTLVSVPGNPRQEKVMAISAAEGIVELEISGKLKLAKDYIVQQKLGDTVVTRKLNEVMVGASNITFHLNERNEITKIELIGETPRNTMRVGIRYTINDITDLTQLDHETIEFTSEKPIRFVDKIGAKQFEIDANTRISMIVSSGSIRIEQNGVKLYETSNRIYISPTVDSSLITVASLKRANGIPKYRGHFEVSLSPVANKLRLINELDIEQYLYQVVPSEMPASFGLEALKAQAIAARTYALTDYLVSRFADRGFHIDDSTLSQVYNNSVENEITNQAVDSTAGQIMLSNGMLVDARFYSTSGGYGASKHEVWADTITNKFPGTPIPYLMARSYTNTPGNDQTMLKIDTANETAVNRFYKDLSHTGYDSDSLYFRWKVGLTRSELEATISKNIKLRFNADPHSILTKQTDGSYASKPIPASGIGELKNLIVHKRGAGGNVTELIIEGSTGTYKIVKEFNIRFTIRPNKTDAASTTDILAYRAKGASTDYDPAATLKNASILYSAFFTFDTERNKEGVIERITFFGGGNGHGVGMSQYGAQMLVKKGWTYSQVLNAYYANMTITKLNAPIITSIAATGPDTLVAGNTASINVRGSFSNGESIAVTTGVSYASSNDTIATVHADGKISANAAGVAIITATVGSFSTQHTITIRPAPTDPGPGTWPVNPGTETKPEKPDPKPEADIQLVDIKEHWAKEAIKRAVKIGIVKGFDDNTFRPQREVSRAEFITLLMRAFPSSESSTSTLGFTDTKDIPTWALASIKNAVSAELITGYDDNSFKPNKPITRAEMTALIVRVAGLQPISDSSLTFIDKDKMPSWARGYIAAAVKAGFMQGRSGNKFAPAAMSTRAEAVVLLLAVLDYKEK